MKLRFGTDGVRGRAFDELTESDVEALGAAASATFGASTFYVGRDTRESGPRLGAALCRGLESGGAQVLDLGVAPTPAVAWLSAADATPGVVISASHNPYHDNGIKLFAPGGRKLSDAEQDAVQARLAPGGDTSPVESGGVEPAAPTSAPVPHADRSRRQVELVARYTDSVVASLGGRSLAGMDVIIDCANGAASAVAPGVLARLGANVEVLFADPDGRNINAGCGSTHPETLQQTVVNRGADVGLAFDGDADRVLAVDATGDLVDGDQILAVCALDLSRRQQLKHNTVVVTVMTNLGFRLAMGDHGIDVVETGVGDRYVLEAIEAGGFSLGGEQSGHIIFSDLASTGDGLLSGVQLLDVMGRRHTTLRDLAGAAMTRLPQVLRNVRFDHLDPTIVDRLRPDVERVERALGATGRVLVRTSGTEPLIRVMVEAASAAIASSAVDDLVERVGRLARIDT